MCCQAACSGHDVCHCCHPRGAHTCSLTLLHTQCPTPIVKARAMLASTEPVRLLRPQALPAKLLAVGTTSATVNIPCGAWREHCEKFSGSWFLAVHASIPFIAMLRKVCCVFQQMSLGGTCGGSVCIDMTERTKPWAIQANLAYKAPSECILSPDSESCLGRCLFSRGHVQVAFSMQTEVQISHGHPCAHARVLTAEAEGGAICLFAHACARTHTHATSTRLRTHTCTHSCAHALHIHAPRSHYQSTTNRFGVGLRPFLVILVICLNASCLLLRASGSCECCVIKWLCDKMAATVPNALVLGAMQGGWWVSMPLTTI